MILQKEQCFRHPHPSACEIRPFRWQAEDKAVPGRGGRGVGWEAGLGAGGRSPELMRQTDVLGP